MPFLHLPGMLGLLVQGPHSGRLAVYPADQVITHALHICHAPPSGLALAPMPCVFLPPLLPGLSGYAASWKAFPDTTILGEGSLFHAA